MTTEEYEQAKADAAAKSQEIVGRNVRDIARAVISAAGLTSDPEKAKAVAITLSHLLPMFAVEISVEMLKASVQDAAYKQTIASKAKAN